MDASAARIHTTAMRALFAVLIWTVPSMAWAEPEPSDFLVDVGIVAVVDASRDEPLRRAVDALDLEACNASDTRYGAISEPWAWILRLTIDARGRMRVGAIERIEGRGGERGAARVRACLTRKLVRMRLDPGTASEATLVVSWHPVQDGSVAGALGLLPAEALEGGTPALAAPPSPPAVATTTEATNAAILRVIRSNLNRMRSCYERGLVDQPTLAGRVAVRFDISLQGVVTTASVHETTLNAPDVEACIVRAVRGLAFDAANRPRAVVYPFVFQLDASSSPPTPR